MKTKINGIIVLPLLVLGGCSSETALSPAAPENKLSSAAVATPSAPVQSAPVSSPVAAQPVRSSTVASAPDQSAVSSRLSATSVQSASSSSTVGALPSSAPSTGALPSNSPATSSLLAASQPKSGTLSSQSSAPGVQKSPSSLPVSAPTPSTPAQRPASQSGYGFDQWQNGPLGDVFFDFDSSVLSDKAKEQLMQNVGWLLANKSANTAIIEGHCDSRGTSEYNLALGERRSTSVKEYLVRLGVPSSRLDAVSFGEERLFDAGKSDDAMAKNRRAHFVIKK